MEETICRRTFSDILENAWEEQRLTWSGNHEIYFVSGNVRWPCYLKNPKSVGFRNKKKAE